MHRIVIFLGSLIVLVAGIFPVAAQEDTIADIVSNAADSDDAQFTVLLTALQEMDLVDVLSSDDTFTVFAPTDAAFEGLLEEFGLTEEELLARDDLSDILLYHVVAVPLDVDDIRRALGFARQLIIQTVNGENIAVRVEDERITVNASEIVDTDIIASNGVIHIIDDVLIPGEADEFEMGPSNLISGTITLGIDGRDIEIIIERGIVNFADGLSARLEQVDGHHIADIDVSGVVQINLLDGPLFSASFSDQGISLNLVQIGQGRRRQGLQFDLESEIVLSGVINIEIVDEPIVVQIQEASTDLNILFESIVPSVENGLDIDEISGELEIDLMDGNVFVITLDDGKVSVDKNGL